MEKRFVAHSKIGDWLVLVIALVFGIIGLIDTLTYLPSFISSSINWVSTSTLVLLISILYFLLRFNHKA